jgi:tetratricopeptide (TPR) repeat protein
MEPENNYALVGLGDSSRKQGKYSKAVSYYETCLHHHPLNNYALFGLADSYKSLQRYNKAIEIWERYLQHDDHNVTVLTRVADAYRKVKNMAKSREIYEKVLSIEADNAYSLIGLGHLYYDFKEFDKALFYWERVVASHGKNVDIRVLTSVGNCHRKLKTFKKGIEYFSRALELEPDNFYALFGMADCYRGLKVILTRIGDAYRALGEYDESEKSYKQAINIEFDAYAILGLSLINKQKGNYAEAIDSLQGLVKTDTRNARLYLEIADCYIRIGKRKQAAQTLASYLELGFRNSYVTELYESLRRDNRRE